MESSQREGVAGEGQDLQVEEKEERDSGKGNYIKLKTEADQSQLPRRKRLYQQLMKVGIATSFLLHRPVSKRRGTEEDLDTGTLEQLLRNLQRHEDSWPFVR